MIHWLSHESGLVSVRTLAVSGCNVDVLFDQLLNHSLVALLHCQHEGSEATITLQVEVGFGVVQKDLWEGRRRTKGRGKEKGIRE